MTNYLQTFLERVLYNSSNNQALIKVESNESRTAPILEMREHEQDLVLWANKEQVNNLSTDSATFLEIQDISESLPNLPSSWLQISNAFHDNFQMALNDLYKTNMELGYNVQGVYNQMDKDVINLINTKGVNIYKFNEFLQNGEKLLDKTKQARTLLTPESTSSSSMVETVNNIPNYFGPIGKITLDEIFHKVITTQIGDIIVGTQQIIIDHPGIVGLIPATFLFWRLNKVFYKYQPRPLESNFASKELFEEARKLHFLQHKTYLMGTALAITFVLSFSRRKLFEGLYSANLNNSSDDLPRTSWIAWLLGFSKNESPNSENQNNNRPNKLITLITILCILWLLGKDNIILIYNLFTYENIVGLLFILSMLSMFLLLGMAYALVRFHNNNLFVPQWLPFQALFNALKNIARSDKYNFYYSSFLGQARFHFIINLLAIILYYFGFWP